MAVKGYHKLKGLLSRKIGYKRLHGHHRLRTSTSDVSDPNVRYHRQKRRIWRRIKISPKLRMFSPNNFFPKSYVNFMLTLASSPAFSGSACGYGAVDYGVGGFCMMPVIKDYDDKVIIDIYKSLVKARGQLADDNSHTVSAT